MEQLDVAEMIFDEASKEPNGATIEAMKQRGLAPALVERLMIIEFGSDASAFQALVPARYIHQGRELLAHEVDETLY